MPILDDDATVIKTVKEHVHEEAIRLYIANQLPPNVVDNLIREIINDNMKKRSVNLRDASYDFCYLYFQSNKGNLGGKNLECSCMHLWSYLASWGMLRGSSTLLQCSPTVLKELIKYFDSISTSHIWVADIDTYNKDKAEIVKVYKKIFSILATSIHNNPSVTLITKIMLGVFGCIPAFDTFFTKTFRTIYEDFRNVRNVELDAIEDFYKKHQTLIDQIVIPVIDFGGNPTKLYYKKAKLIDMFGFAVGQHIKP